MTPETLRHLTEAAIDCKWLAVFIWNGEAIADARRIAGSVRPDADPWPAIDAATNFLRRYFPDGYTIDAPPALTHWHRAAWLDVIRAAAAAAGHGDDDAPRWANMTAAELADELTYMADYQG